MKMGGRWVDCSLMASRIWDSERDSDKEDRGEARIARNREVQGPQENLRREWPHLPSLHQVAVR